jgi:photosystem II stability/assembly factor-like uncharacterized protein
MNTLLLQSKNPRAMHRDLLKSALLSSPPPLTRAIKGINVGTLEGEVKVRKLFLRPGLGGFLIEGRLFMGKRPPWSSAVEGVATFVVVALLVMAAVFSESFVPKATPAELSIRAPVVERADLFFGVCSPTPSELWMVGNFGKVVRSQDGGVTWHTQQSPTNENIQDIAAWDDMRAVAVGDGGVVLQTEDGGTTWRLEQAPRSKVQNKLLRVHAYSGGCAWAVGVMGALYRSGDYGKTWSRQHNEEDVAWNDLCFPTVDQGWVVGEFGRMLHTVDGGDNWTEVASPVKQSLMAVSFRDSLHGVTVGLTGVLLTTSDGGATWQEIPSGTPNHLFDVVWDRQHEQWFATGDNAIVITAGKDASEWHASHLGEFNYSWHTKAVPFDGGVFLVGAQQGLFKGGSWTPVS